ncbi:MAG TPA: TonB-dependent receptor, partial [Chitinophagaceae bacterium]|nr:TonB-dependent receptor [Chitinophagaceae bacterium]
RGRITNENGEPVQASIVVKGTQNGTSSNTDGYYELKNVDEKATLVITGVGIEPQEIRVNSRVTINVTIKIAVKEGDEVVVAYGKQKQQAITGAVTVVKGEQIATLPNRSFDKSLQGLVPGLLVTPGTGQPGGGVSNFLLRGISTAASPANGSVVRNPLIVIDGVPVSQEPMDMYFDGSNTTISNPLAQLNPGDIESITVLKDAAAIALYGAQSSNGVIMVTTKKGKAGKTRFSFRHQADFADATKLPELLNQQEYLELLYETYKNTSPTWNDATILADLKTRFPTRSDGSFYPQPDWIGELFKKNATTFSNQLSASGGNEKTTFYLNLEYTKQNGILKATGFDRKSLRLNLEHRAAHWLKFGINSTLSHNIQDYGGTSATSNMSMQTFQFLSPLHPFLLENGEYVAEYPSSFLTNPAAAAKYNINKNTAFRGISNLYIELNILKSLSLLSNVGFDFMLNEGKEKNDPRLFDRKLGKIGGRIDEVDTRRLNLISTNILKYNKSIGNHNVGLQAGQEARILNQKILRLGVTGFTSPYYDQITSPGAAILPSNGFGGYVLQETLLSYFGQLNYDYANRYFLTATIRRDGSSRFGEDKRFGTYWSTGAGWIISSEPFMGSTKKWLDYLKIRGSIGAAGNAGAIDRFTPFDPLNAGQYSASIAVWSSSLQAGNADVKWENTFSWDAGLEFRLFKERLSVSTDIYKRTTKDLIYPLPLPGSTGSQSILANIGTMQNKGVEVSISGDIIRGRHFKWRLNANWSTNQNKLVKANNALPQQQLTFVFSQQGQNFNSFYLRRWAGVDPASGAALYIDSTGKPNSNVNAAKRDFVGKVQPDGFGAVTNTFSYKGVELAIMLYYQYGYQIYNVTRSVPDGASPYANETSLALDRWQKPGDQTANPIRKLNNASGSVESTRFLFDGDHIRLQNISLGYQFPSKLIQPLKLSGLKLFVQGNNIAVLTTSKTRAASKDPGSTDVYSRDYYSYPIQRTWSLGFTVNF